MKGKLSLIALSALALASCSNEETTNLNPGNAIDFSATAPKPGRAAATTATLDNFKVWGFTQKGGDGADAATVIAYMNGVDVTKNTTSGKWEYSPVMFWPASTVDFFAVSPKTAGTPNVTATTKTLAYTVNATGDEDLLYSTTVGASKGAQVALNFRHALSCVKFNVKLKDNSPIKVTVKDITLKNIKNSGTLTLASATTASLGAITSADTETGNTWGTWALGSGVADYAVATGVNDIITNDVKNFATLFLMPQKLTEWNPAAGTSAVANGARLVINCVITDATSGALLYSGNVAVAVNNPVNDPAHNDSETNCAHKQWKQGKIYNYTLIFGQGGGYTDEPNNPKPVLAPIEFTVSVDNFQDGGNDNIPD